MCFVFGALKVRDESIPLLKQSPRPPGALSTVGPSFRTSNFCFSGCPVVREGGTPKIDVNPTLSAMTPKDRLARHRLKLHLRLEEPSASEDYVNSIGSVGHAIKRSPRP